MYIHIYTLKNVALKNLTLIDVNFNQISTTKS